MPAPPRAPNRDDAWPVTLAFWATLLAAGALFAAVSLAPKLKTLADLDAEYAANQLRLVELERRAAELEKVADALEHDPAFAAELAKLEFAAGNSGEERIDLPPELRLGASDAPPAVSPHAAAARRMLPQPVLVPLATSRPLRATLLASSAMLALAAFVLLHERHAAAIRILARGLASTTQAVTSRYQKNEPPGSPRRPSRRAA